MTIRALSVGVMLCIALPWRGACGVSADDALPAGPGVGAPSPEAPACPEGSDLVVLGPNDGEQLVGRSFPLKVLTPFPGRGRLSVRAAGVGFADVEVAGEALPGLVTRAEGTTDTDDGAGGALRPSFEVETGLYRYRVELDGAVVRSVLAALGTSTSPARTIEFRVTLYELSESSAPSGDEGAGDPPDTRSVVGSGSWVGPVPPRWLEFLPPAEIAPAGAELLGEPDTPSGYLLPPWGRLAPLDIAIHAAPGDSYYLILASDDLAELERSPRDASMLRAVPVLAAGLLPATGTESTRAVLSLGQAAGQLGAHPYLVLWTLSSDRTWCRSRIYRLP